MKTTIEKMRVKLEEFYFKALSDEERYKEPIIGCLDYSYIEDRYVIKDAKTMKNHIIKPNTICRNSCIKDKNDIYVYEYDLLKLTHGMKTSCYGFLVWDEFYKSWKIRRRTDRTAYNNLDDWTIEVVGNIVLNDADLHIIINQEKEEDTKETFIDTSYCPSKFRR